MEIDLLNKAIQIATIAHKGQKDKEGNDYIQHPLRVMKSVASMDEKITAILHDVAEKTPVTFQELEKQGIPENIIKALKLLTHNPDVPYFDYIRAIKSNALAITVKLADLKDNFDVYSKKNPSQETSEKMVKYFIAMRILIGDD